MEEALIEGVREFPCLWQVSSRSYKDLRAKENAWKEVAKKVGDGYTVDNCMKRWKGLRDKFVREFKKVKKRISGEEGPVYVSCWPLYHVIEFISNTVKHKTGSSNVTVASVDSSDSQNVTHSNDDSLHDQMNSENSSGNSSTVDEDAEDTVDTDKPITPPTSDKKRNFKKRSRNDDIDELLVKSLNNSLQEKKQKIGEDEEGLFGKQVAATLRRFNPHQKAIAKLQIQQAITNIEFSVDANFMRPYPSPTAPYSSTFNTDNYLDNDH